VPTTYLRLASFACGPSEAVFEDLEGVVTVTPHVYFGGLYRNPKDLPVIYYDVGFNLEIDF
jgi:hypothetical protein